MQKKVLTQTKASEIKACIRGRKCIGQFSTEFQGPAWSNK